MKKSIIFLTIAIILFGGYFLLDTTPNVTANTIGVNSNNDDAQKIVLSTKNYNYYPNTITVKSGKPVSITLDETVFGCLRDFTIRQLGIRKYLRTPADTLEFTPTQPGTYRFSCSMGMGTGTLIVS